MVEPSDLLASLEGVDPGSFEVTLMPDFYVDHLIRFPSFPDTMASFERVRAQRGGGVRPESQMLSPGGNASNTANALARVGVRANLVARTSPMGRLFLESTLAREGVDVSRVRTDGPLAVTAAIECPDGSVMVTGPRGCADLAPEDLEDEDWDLVARSDAVLVANWANGCANDLAPEAFRVAKRSGARTYADTGDPFARAGGEEERLREVIRSGNLDVLSVNAFELHHYVPDAPEGPEGLPAAGRALSRQMGGRLDLHSNDLAGSFRGGRMEAVAPRFRVAARQTTGAGDTWNAGAILGDLLGLPPEERILLANALAGLYVASEEGVPPTLDEVRAFLADARVEPLTIPGEASASG